MVEAISRIDTAIATGFGSARLIGARLAARRAVGFLGSCDLSFSRARPEGQLSSRYGARTRPAARDPANWRLPPASGVAAAA